MTPAAEHTEESIEQEFSRTIRYIDLYLQQKTDLFLQHYVFEPVDYLLRQVMWLSVIVTLLAAGTLALVAGTILFLATLVPLWAAFLIMGILVCGLGSLIARMLLSNKIVLKTPVAVEMIRNGKL